MKTTISLYITLVLGLLFTIIWSCTDDTDVLEGESSFVKGTVPVISLTNMTSIGYTDASVEVKVENTGARKVSRLALCYNTTGTEPCKDDQILELGEVNVNNNNTTHLANLINLTHNTTYYIRAYAVNSEGESYSDSIRFSTKLDIRLPQVTTEATSGLGKTGATLYGEVTNIGQSNITQYGFVYATHNNPTFEDFKTQKGELTNTAKFTDGLIGLESSTLYYYRAYATNSFGTSFGVLASFITYGIPQVSTTDITEITYTNAKAGCNVTFNGGQSITACGIVWSTIQNPDLTTNEGIIKISSYIENYHLELSNLTQGTTYYVRAFATNSNGTAYGEQKVFSTIIGNLAKLNTVDVIDITYNSATSGGTIIDDGKNNIIAKGVVWNKQVDPTIQNKIGITIDGGGLNSFSSKIKSITASTRYYIRAYATTQVGTAYGETKIFTTLPPVLATVKTKTIIEIQQNSAVGGGTIDSDGGVIVTSRGICWNTTGNPTINDSKTSNGNGIGTYTSKMENLSESTTYYVRSYAVNNVGTNYGEEIKFTTLPPILPIITTTPASNITLYSATSGGNMINIGSSALTARGICYGTFPNPKIENNIITDKNLSPLIGEYTCVLSALTANTTYYIRAFATNRSGTNYGNQISFTTSIIYGKVTDIDNNEYKTVTIGDQTWMAENLKVTKFNNGDLIETTIPATLDLSNDINPVYQWPCKGDEIYVPEYGRVYTWYTVIDNRGLCPLGWHLPSIDEWEILINVLGGNSIAGGMLKEVGTNHWISPNTGATDEIGFRALPGGFRSFFGKFNGFGQNCGWWTLPSLELTNVSYYSIRNNSPFISKISVDKNNLSLPIRCLKDR